MYFLCLVDIFVKLFYVAVGTCWNKLPPFQIALTHEHLQQRLG